MQIRSINSVTTAEQARDLAIEWQDWQSDKSLSIGELADWQGYFTELANKFTNLKNEFIENGII